MVFNAYGHIEKIFVNIRELEWNKLETPDVDITDAVTGGNILSVNGVASSTTYYTKVLNVDVDGTALDTTANEYSKPIAGKVKVTVTGAGDEKTGIIYLWVTDN